MIVFSSSHSLRSILAGTFFVLCLLVSPSITHADDRYWVLGTGDWDDTGHWSATSGGASGATAPDANDKAHFDGYSGGGVVTVNTAVNVNALHLSSAFSGSIMQTSNTIRVGTGDILVGSGRLIGGNATLSLSGSYTQTGGIVTSQSTLTLSGSMSVTKPGSTTSPAPSFTSTGTVVFEGKVDQNLTQGDGATLTLKTLTLNNTGAGTADDLIVNMSGGLNLSGALTITLGNLDLDTANIVLHADGGLTLADAAQATLVSDANMSLSGTVLVNNAATFTVSGSTTVTLNDTGDQSVDFDGQVLRSVAINNTGGGSDDDVTIAGGGFTLSGSLTVTLGNLDLDTNNQALIIESNATLADAAQATLTTDAAVRVGGNLLVNDAATLTMSGNNTLTLNGTADQTFDVDGQRLRNVTINNSGGGSADDVVVAGGGLNFSGTLTVTLGNLDLSTNDQTLSVSGSLTIASAAQATLSTDADVSLSGSLTVGALGTATLFGSMTLTLDGIDQNIDVNNGSISSLTIASGSGTTLTDYLKVTGTLQINTGSTISLGSQTLSGTSSTIINYGTIAENEGKIVHTISSFLITDSSYAEVSAVAAGGSFYFQLDEIDENISGTAADTVDITVVTSASDSETVTLTETTNTSGIFQGSIATADQTVSVGNGTLDSTNTVGVTATFTDAQDSGTANDSSSLSNPQNTGSSGGGGGSSGGGGGGGGGRRNSVIRVNDDSSEDNGTVEDTSDDTMAPSSAMPWSDLSPSHQFSHAALLLYEAGIVKGNDDGTVMLDRSISRVEALTLLVRTLGTEASDGVNLPFSDVDASAWYAAPLRAALELAIIKGFPDGTFRPGDSLNLVQSLKIISIALGLAFQTDEEGMVYWFDPYVAAGREHGLISGSIDRERSVTRGEFFGWLVKLLPQE